MMPLAMRSLARLLEKRTGQEVVPGRRWRLDTALAPVLRRHDIGSLDMLAGLVVQGRDQTLIDEVVEAMLNHETSFYRDLTSFRMLADEALPALAAARAGERRLRLWSAGCSTGQEAYSLAMTLAADAGRWDGWQIEIVGTDISATAVAQARNGAYSQFEAQRGMPVKDLLRHFTLADEVWRVDARLRERTAFRVHNLLDAPPPGSFDLILCRNVLLYFAADRRARVFERLAEAIAPDGLLMLGVGETALGQTDAFEPHGTIMGLYRRVPR